MATEAERRQELVDEAKVREMKAMLDVPGGRDEIVKKFGHSAVDTKEYEAAAAQHKRAQAQRRAGSEERDRRAQQAKEFEARKAGHERRAQAAKEREAARPASTAELQDRLRQGQKNIRAADQRAARDRERSSELGRDRVQVR